MPSFDTNVEASEYVKILYVGASGAGKTGSLVSLVKAGYHVHILDLENGYKVLKNFVLEECPENARLVDFEVVQDRFKMTSTGPKILGGPRAFVRSTELLDKWIDGTDPGAWGPQHVLIVETLTALGRAAFEWAKAQNPMAKDPRQWYFGAQEVIDSVIGTITSSRYATHVIVTTHMDLVEGENKEVRKAFPTTIGKALGPKIGRHFNNLILAESSGVGKFVKRKIKTVQTAEIDLKIEAPMRVSEEYPLNEGLASIFKGLTGA